MKRKSHCPGKRCNFKSVKARMAYVRSFKK